MALVFAASAALLFGLAGAATEAGSWYLARRKAQNAADASATASVLVLASRGGSGTYGALGAAQAAGSEMVARNGFAPGGRTTVSVLSPPARGPNAGNASAVEVEIRQPQRRTITGIFLKQDPVLTVRAVATLQGISNACVLALTGGLSMGGNSLTAGSNCVLASNAPGTGSIQVQGSATVKAYSLVTQGGCSGCAGGAVSLSRPFSEFQPPASNPYAKLDTKVLPSFPSGSCLAAPASGSVVQPYETNGHKAICSDVKLSGNSTLKFAPGTHYLNDASLTVQSGTVTCQGCTGGAGVTIVFTGNSPASIGGVQINANASVTLAAPSSAADPDYTGVLFFRDGRATTNSTSNPAVQINGGAATTLTGGLYFPNSYVRYNGNAGTAPSDCTALVAGTIDFSGSAETYLNLAGCPGRNTAVPQAQTVRLTE